MHIPPTLELLLRCGKALVGRYRIGERKTRQAVSGSSRGDQAEVLRESLHSVGIAPGDVLMVHADSEAIERIGFTLSDFADVLLDRLGWDGTLAVPTHPNIVERDGRRVYDVRRCPSTVGLFSEIVRRRTGALRSSYPISSAAAIGRKARELVGDHERSFAPHDEYSPYAKLAELGGKVLCVGVPITRMTIIHVAEDVMRDHLSIEDFYETMTVWVRDERGLKQLTARKRAPWLWWYLGLCRWTRDMYRLGLVRDIRIDGVRLHLSEASKVVAWMRKEALVGRSIYPLAGLNRFMKLGAPYVGEESRP